MKGKIIIKLNSLLISNLSNVDVVDKHFWWDRLIIMWMHRVLNIRGQRMILPNGGQRITSPKRWRCDHKRNISCINSWSFCAWTIVLPLVFFKWSIGGSRCNLIGAFFAGMIDLETLDASLKASGKFSAMDFKWRIHWTSLSPSPMQGSGWEKFKLVVEKFKCFSLSCTPSKDGKLSSSRTQSANLALNRLPVEGSKY